MEVERPASAGPNHSRPTSRTASERSVSERVSNRPSTAGSRVSLDELTGLDTELKKSQEEVNRLKLECIRWESAAAESAAAEEDAKYQTQLKELEVQALKDRLAVFDPVLIEERNRALRLRIQELQGEIVELKEGKYEEAVQLQHHSFQIRAHMEAEYRRRVHENEARLTEQLRAELPADARQALVDRDRLRGELQALQESVGSVTSRSRLAETRQKQSSVSEALSRSLAEEQAKAAVQLRKRCEAAEEKQLETEQKLAAALRAIEELRARPEEARETGTGSGSGSGTGTANVSGIGTGSGSPKSSGNGSGSGFESGSASGKTSGNGTGIRPEPGRSNGVAGQEAATTSARGKENAEGGLASRDGVGRKAAVGGSRLRPASAHPRLQVALPPEVESNGTERERQLNNAREVDVSKETCPTERADLAIKLMEAQQSEAKWRRRVKILQETNARLEATLQQKGGNDRTEGSALPPDTLDKQARERPKTAKPFKSKPFF